MGKKLKRAAAAAKATRTLRLQSDFALLDVKRGRRALAKVVARGSGRRVPVVIVGFITDQSGNDDGTSIEFTVKVQQVTTGPVEGSK